MAPQQSAKFRIAFFGQFRTSLRKVSVANYASIWTLFSLLVRGLDVLCNALNILQFRWQVTPQDLQICSGNFQKRKKICAELCPILRIVTIYNVVRGLRGVLCAIICPLILTLDPCRGPIGD